MIIAKLALLILIIFLLVLAVFFIVTKNKKYITIIKMTLSYSLYICIFFFIVFIFLRLIRI